MSDPETHLLAHWFEEVWNKGREEMIDQLAAPDVIAHGLVDSRGQEISGREKFHTFWREFRSSFPDVHITVEDTLTDGDKVMARCTVKATHRSDGIGVAPTLKPVTFTGMVLGRVRGGQLVEVWDNWDFLGFYQQLGVVPASLV